MQSCLKITSNPLFLKCFNSVEQVRFYFYPVVKRKWRQHLYFSLKERLEEKDPKLLDPERYRKVDIGIPPTKRKVRHEIFSRSKLLRELKSDVDLEKKSRSRNLFVDLDLVEEEWNDATRPLTVRNLAEHFQIFEHLFGPYATFEPYVYMDISFDNGDVISPVYTGNLLKPSEVPTKPEISFKSEENDVWSFVLLNLDGNLYDNESEMVQWMVTNIPGGRVGDGEEIVPYMPPLPPNGTGFHRCVFLLYKQDKMLDFSKYSIQKSSSSLEDRTFKNETMYREYENNITPAGLSWFQADWDISVNKAFHNMDLKAPSYRYEFPKQFIKPQVDFPKGKGFDKYMDLHRPEKELQERLLLNRLSRTNPIRGDVPLLPYPLAQERDLPRDMPVWLKKDLARQWEGRGIYRDLYRGDERPLLDGFNKKKHSQLPPWPWGES